MNKKKKMNTTLFYLKKKKMLTKKYKNKIRIYELLQKLNLIPSFIYIR